MSSNDIVVAITAGAGTQDADVVFAKVIDPASYSVLPRHSSADPVLYDTTYVPFTLSVTSGSVTYLDWKIIYASPGSLLAPSGATSVTAELRARMRPVVLKPNGTLAYHSCASPYQLAESVSYTLRICTFDTPFTLYVQVAPVAVSSWSADDIVAAGAKLSSNSTVLTVYQVRPPLNKTPSCQLDQ